VKKDKLAKPIARKKEKLRRQYREIRGKRVDWISHHADEGLVTLQVQFMDGTRFLVQYGHSEFVLDLVSHADASSGDLKVIRDYYVRRFD